MRRDYGAYVEYSNPGFVMTHFHRYLCDQIQEFLEHESDKAMSILLVSMPPRFGKEESLNQDILTTKGGRNSAP